MCADFKGAAWAFAELMKQAQAEIDSGKRLGADRRWKYAHPRLRSRPRWWSRVVKFSSK